MWRLKTILTLIVLTLLAALLAGCWNRKELDELGIQMGTAIDKVGHEYHVAVQVVVPGEVSTRQSGGRSTVTLYKATAPTLFEAFRKLTETSPRKIYSAHIRVLVLGESLARDGIANVLDLFSRNPEARPDFYIMVARDTPAEKVLGVLTALEKIPAYNLFYSLDTSAKTWAPTTTVTMDQLMEDLTTAGRNPVLTGVTVIGNTKGGEMKQSVEQIEPEARLLNVGLAAFRRDRMVGWLTEEEAKGYNYIIDNVRSTAGHLSCPDGGMVALETIRTKTKIKGALVDGKPVIRIHMTNQSNISDVECKLDLNDPHTIDQLEEQGRKKLINLMQKTVDNVKKKYKVDIFGFGQAIHRANPKAWNQYLEAEWNELFQQVKVEYELDVMIRRIGTTVDSIKNDIKE
ncbi:Ger(x)C family spore germination protein [Paenibacillus filicis]|uniref:Ger(X)C family spore germination protein n=1 Tax=Paenibacillus filicis TaxID=669464 RepID=A0ABU9DVC3_9BACL